MISLKKQVNSATPSADKSAVRINKKIAKFLYLILAIVSAALLIIAIYASASGESANYPAVNAIIFIVLGVAISISLIAFNPGKSFYDLGFYILHTGIVIFLCGMIIFGVKGSSHYVSLPNLSSVDSAENLMKSSYGWSDNDIHRLKSYRNQIGREDGEIIDLGFNFRIADFVTEYYEDGESVKHYEATVEFFLRDGTIEEVPLTVNHPIYRNDWKIYLMNVGVSPYGYEQVNLLIKNDPAEFLSVAGIILTILGTFIMCLLPGKRQSFRKNDAKEGSDGQ